MQQRRHNTKHSHNEPQQRSSLRLHYESARVSARHCRQSICGGWNDAPKPSCITSKDGKKGILVVVLKCQSSTQSHRVRVSAAKDGGNCSPISVISIDLWLIGHDEAEGCMLVIPSQSSLLSESTVLPHVIHFSHNIVLSPLVFQPAAFEAAHKERRLSYCQPENLDNSFSTEQTLKAIQMPKPFSLWVRRDYFVGILIGIIIVVNVNG